jgi:hypothetical protein
VRSRHEQALSILLSHGWPGSVIEFLKLISVPRSWADKVYPNIIHWNELDKGGHFAAFEQPALFARELRDCFRGIRDASSAPRGERALRPLATR